LKCCVGRRGGSEENRKKQGENFSEEQEENLTYYDGGECAKCGEYDRQNGRKNNETIKKESRKD
jgi:hypothetical protein